MVRRGHGRLNKNKLRNERKSHAYPREPKKLSTTLFVTIFCFSIAVVLVAAASMTSVYYFSHESSAEARLLTYADKAADVLNDAVPDTLNDTASGTLNDAAPATRTEILAAQLPTAIRYTLISADGEVLYDSAANADAEAKNHADRPEVQNAQTNGAGTVIRYSETLGQDTINAAVRLNDGSVIRLSEARESFAAFISSFAVATLVVLVVIAGLAAVFTKLLTRRIIAPLDSLDVSRPLQNDAYSEMLPLLERIDRQHRQLKDQNVELARAESMRRDFSANVSHELKTPLQVISGYSEIIEGGLATNADVKSFARIIHAEAQNMRALVDDVLVLSRLDEPMDERAQSVKVDLLEMAKAVAMRLSPLSSAGNIDVRVVGSSAIVEGNERLLELALVNLVNNAIRYSFKGGTVVVDVRPPTANAAPTPAAGATSATASFPTPLSAPAPCAIISVQDEGCGIPPADQSKIFERFYRVDKSRSRETGGTGLGLAIAKHAVEFHGGTITVQSAPGQGSTFIVRLPAYPA